MALAPPAAALGWRALGGGLPTSGQWRQGFAVADFDGDGALDLAHGPARRGDGRPVIFLGDGRGGFARWREARFPDLPFDYGAAAAADFDGDGRMDVALGSHLRGLTVLRGDGAGSFARWDEGLVLAGSGEAFSSRALAAIDWNADGRPDLAALGEGPSPSAGEPSGSYGLRVFLNRGDGSWGEAEGADPGRLFGYSLAAGDLDGDGVAELVTSSRSQGHRTVVHARAAGGGIAAQALPGVRKGSVLQAVATLDADRDGRHEVAASFFAPSPSGDWIAGLDVYEIDGSRQAVLTLPDALEISVVASGDLDGDGRVDLLAAGVRGRVWVFSSTRAGEWKRVRAGAIERASGGCKASHAQLVDLDGEPGDEIILSFSGEPRGEQCPNGGSIQVWKAKI